MLYFIKGFLVGISIAAPVGPIGVLCIRRTLAHGRLEGFVCGLGAAVADFVYGCVGAFGLSLIINALFGFRFWLQLVGGVYLLYLGVTILRSKPAQLDHSTIRRTGLLKTFLSTLVLTLTNPMTIFSFMAIFAGLGFAPNSNDVLAGVTLVAGVLLGSATWWLFLSFTFGLFRKRLKTSSLHWVNIFSGLIITAFGLYALASCVK